MKGLWGAILFSFTILFVPSGKMMAEDVENAQVWNLTVGSKGVYASGISEANTSYTVFGEASLELKFFELAVRGSRLLDYQITDGLGLYTYVDINEGSAKASIHPFDFVGVGGEYKFAAGDSSFERREWSSLLRIGPDKFFFEAEYGKSNTGYCFTTTDIEIQRANTSLSLSWDVSDRMSMEIGYDRNSIEFSNLNYEYIKQGGRLGAFFEACESLFIMAGISGGADSESYAIAGADLGAVLIVFSRVKISAFYLFEQYIAPSSSSSTSTNKMGGSKMGTSNPYLSTEKIGESYSSHRLSIGASISLF